MVDQLLTGLIQPSSDDVERYAEPKVITLDGAPVPDDWDPELFIAEDMFEMYLQAVQQGKSRSPDLVKALGGKKKYDRNTTFEDFLEDALKTVRYDREQVLRDDQNLQDWLRLRQLTLSDRAHLLTLIEMQESAISKYLEKTKRERLIGV